MKRMIPILLFTLMPALGLADGPDSASAEALFREGRTAAEAGHYALACSKFEDSYRIEPAPGTLLNLGDCEENQGHLTRALEHFRQLRDQLPATDDRKPIAAARARAIEQRESKVRVVDVPAPAPAIVSPAVVFVHQPSTAQIPASNHGSVQRTATLVVGGTGLAFVTTGAILGVVALSRLSASNAMCRGNVCANEEAVSQFRGAQSFAVAADVAIAVGIVLIGTAIVVALTPRSSRTARALPVWIGGRF
jgi:tetratricopeptide (TPR) repeat protein